MSSTAAVMGALRVKVLICFIKIQKIKHKLTVLDKVFQYMLVVKYGQTCLKGSPKGTRKNGCLRQVTP